MFLLIRIGGICCLLTFAGCARDEVDGRVAVAGTVTYDGQPVAAGRVRFTPAPGTSGPSSGGEIQNGRFRIAAEDGPGLGEYVVSVSVGAPPSRQKFGQNSQTDHAYSEFRRTISQTTDLLTFDLSSNSEPSSQIAPR